MPNTQKIYPLSPDASTVFPPLEVPGSAWDTAMYAEGSPALLRFLIAKLITRGKRPSEAIARMSRALEMFAVEGIYTTIPLHRKILADPDFQRTGTSTQNSWNDFWPQTQI